MKASTLLTKAKKLLPNDRLYGICYAVSMVPKASDKDIDRVCDVIGERLGAFSMATSWLAAQMINNGGWHTLDWRKRDDWVRKQDPRDIQAWRLAWMDQLIVEFKSKGD